MGNTAQQGGAMYLTSLSNVVVEFANVSSNTASGLSTSAGGAVYTQDSQLAITYSYLLANRAIAPGTADVSTVFGGAVACRVAAATPSVSPCS